jgi:hypothetical protein
MRSKLALALLLMATLAGCGKELVVGGYKHVDGNATGDGTPEGGSPVRTPAYDRMASTGPYAVAGRAQGTIAFTSRVTLRTADGRSAPLNTSATTTTVRIDGGDTVHVVSADVPAGSYPSVRVTFTGVQANVTGGLTVGGVAFTGLATVALLPGDSIVVERAVNLGGSTTSTRLLIDLDASAWLPGVDHATRLVPTATFRDAVKIRTY